MGKNKMVFGHGINDADYQVNWSINGVKFICPFYVKWYEMIRRCYSKRYHNRQPTYICVEVCQEWLTFSKFKAWMETQDWEGKELDKDLLLEGNKLYEPTTCCFISKTLNCFIKDTYHSLKGRYRGVSFNNKAGKYQAQCSNPFTKKRGHCGYYDDPYLAHLAWLNKKREFAARFAEMENDPSIVAAILNKF